MDEVVNNKRKIIVSRIGVLLTVVSVVFIVRRFFQVELDYAIFTSPVVVAGLIAIAFVNGFIIILTAINYRALLYNVTGVMIPLHEVNKVYCSANLYKYIPGGILSVLGRNRLAVDNEELSHSKVAAATVLEGVFFILAALVITLAYSSDYAVQELRQLDILPIVLATIAGIIIVIALVVYFTRHRIKRFLESVGIKGVLKPPVLVKRAVAALVLANMWGFMFMWILALMGQPITPYIIMTVIGLFGLSWLVGFFVPIAPAGLGIREAAILMFIGVIVPDSYLLLAVMVHRVSTIIGDIIAYGIAICHARAKTPKTISKTI